MPTRRKATAARNPAARPAGSRTGGRTGPTPAAFGPGPATRPTPTSSSYGTHPRIDEPINNIGQYVHQNYRAGENDERALQQRLVRHVDPVVQQAAQSRPGIHHLDRHGPGYDESQLQE